MAFSMFMYSFLIEIAISNTSSSSTWKYRLTAEGRDFLAKEGQEDVK